MSEIWRCDSCGKDINSVEAGWVEWLRDRDSDKYYGMRIVHHDEKCMYNDRYEHFENNNSVLDMHLSSFYSQDGHISLLELISDGQFKNNDEVLEVIKRLFIPDYEVARLYFRDAISEGYFEPNTKENYHHTLDIQRTMDYIRHEGIN
ncbi:hypothetical protein [Trichococcus shcherbakoviae]|uniref:hypothetical protein n=1 Tax=Trichococcus shcherbakoviae TaxID=2094020 RepID=UPI002AA5F6A4|nr:hypothetical protein [Trichococcus shcherbakoviae]